jgi:integral membrane protein (TIGR01906 family)
MKSWIVAVATAFVILGASLLPFLTPAWVGFEQDRSGSAALVGYPPAEVHSITSSILGDLVLSRGDFAVARDGAPVLTDAERGHMRDVRGVFEAFYLLVVASIVVLAVTFRRARGRDSRSGWWHAAQRGAAGLAIAIAILGVVSLVAFDAAFEVFHRLFFPAGTYSFDPRTSHLVQLFPDQFWSETTIAVAVVAILASLATTWSAAMARRRGGTIRPITSTTSMPARASR